MDPKASQESTQLDNEGQDGDEEPGKDDAEAGGDEDEAEAEELRMEDVPALYHDFESEGVEQSKESLSAPVRDKWTNKVEFIMVLLSIAVGLGNIWRFPFQALQNGGGAFLIPYLLVVVFISRPMYLLEMAIGQFCARGPVGMWDSVPLFRGVGWVVFLISFITGIYYITILATCVLYIVHGWSNELPWSRCHNESGYYSPSDHFFLKNFTCEWDANISKVVGAHYRNLTNGTIKRVPVTNAELFYKFVILKQTDNMDHGLGPIQWQMAAALLFMWFLTFGNMILGTKSSGKAAYFTAVFPYLMLLALFIRACFLPGAGTGMLYFLTPQWDKLGDLKVWSAAISQSFFSLGIGYGSSIMCGSFNPFRQTTYNDAMLVGLVDTFTSIFAGLTVFAVVGALGEKKGIDITYKKNIEKVVSAGPGLAFIAYPELVTYFGPYPVPQIFSFFFFLMLVTLGIGSHSSYIHVITATLYDQYPVLARDRWTKLGVLAVVCVVLFLLGLQFCTAGGQFLLDVYGDYGSNNIVFVVALFETLGFCWVYGMKHGEHDFRFMFDKYKSFIFKCECFTYWGYAMPIFFGALLVYSCVNTDSTKVTVFYEVNPLPLWATIYGWLMFGVGCAIIPIVGVIVLCTRKTRNFKKKFYASIFPNVKWGPKEPQEKLKWVEYKKALDGETWLWKQFQKFSNCCPQYIRRHTLRLEQPVVAAGAEAVEVSETHLRPENIDSAETSQQ